MIWENFDGVKPQLSRGVCGYASLSIRGTNVPVVGCGASVHSFHMYLVDIPYGHTSHHMLGINHNYHVHISQRDESSKQATNTRPS